MTGRDFIAEALAKVFGFPISDGYALLRAVDPQGGWEEIPEDEEDAARLRAAHAAAKIAAYVGSILPKKAQ